jgi:acetylornithine deacetylase/succinyl-diaminopimelate desuccinylase-like protein
MALTDASDRLQSDPGPAAVRAEVSRQRPAILAELRNLIRIPSVSAEPPAADAVRRCAEAIATILRRLDLADGRLVETATHPIVVGSWMRATGRPTLLIYGHYDVQPAGPIGLWRHPPFGASIDGDLLIGRGSSDDKGQLMVHLAALSALRTMTGRYPVNVVVVADGAEEIGSPELARLLDTPGPWQTTDAALISDTRMAAPGRPALTASLRGLVSLEVIVERPGPEVHAGHFGGALPDPLTALAGLVAGLHDERGRIAVPGFHAAVRLVPRAPSPVRTRRDHELIVSTRSVPGVGEPGWSLDERATTRPALTVTGLAGGSVGTHGRAVVANRGQARLDVRLVADQQPSVVAAAIRRRLQAACPPGVSLRVRLMSAVPPASVDLGHPVSRLAAAALRDGFRISPTILRSGGSSPAVAALRARAIPVALMGFALPDGRIHGPNESLHLPTFFRAIVASASFLTRLGRASSR